MREHDAHDVLAQIEALCRHEMAFTDDRILDMPSIEAYFAGVRDEVANNGGFALVARLADAPDTRARPPCAHACVVVREDDAYVEEHRRRYAYVSDLFVAQDARGIGIGTALMAEVEHRTRAMGLNRIGIGALAGNALALDAYRGWGFKPYVVHFVKDLDPDGAYP
ncbi:MAG: GNAT family N-acetyltransferase [Hyphomicrobiaceae bacterium]